jgi:hypothetical protein
MFCGIYFFRALLMGGADPGLRNSAGHTVLDTLLTHSPSTSSSSSSAGRLLQPFVDELFRCVAAGDLPRLRVLLAAGLAVGSLVDGPVSRNSALHWAASFGPPHVIDFLVSSEGRAEGESGNIFLIIAREKIKYRKPCRQGGPPG